MYKTMLHALSNLPVVKSNQFVISLFTKMAQICECPSVECVWYHMVVAHTAKNQTDLPSGSRCRAEC